ncbi:MAG: 4-hydroxythreonine-4-phosphate dehydrogenase PdxA [Deltaproteobacteria bacterium]|nr:4-hydroxythreonine-4-phosphate dehydrogenase PdxA [Deltaproteobacteria bacterium]MBW1996197.1 4-hydroxythreonine-4-phosphate dehydrogenase PdxA [Deltaproteobacteria bacterium]
MRQKPIVAITMGEASGIGPEILVKVLAEKKIHEICRPLAVGDGKILQRAAELFKANIEFNKILSPRDAIWDESVINLIDHDRIDLSELQPGRPNATTGQAMLEDTKLLVEYFRQGSIHAGVGGPHSKKAAELAGYNFVGYPYYIADLIGAPNPFMMLVAGKLRIANTTLHVSLKEACDMITKQLVLEVIEAVNDAVGLFGIDNPRIAVTGLNPHAGEEGMFGTEETDQIQPAIEEANTKGIEAFGPFPADSLFYQCNTNPRYDAYVCMYHDQAHIPVKVESFLKASAVAIGIPYIFATVDHGCAPDIAWQGVADHGVIRTTIELVSQMAKNKFSLS